MVGGLGFLIDASLTYFLISTNIPSWIARIPAIVLAMFFTWFFNRFFTYKIKSDPTSKEAIRYVVIAVLMAFNNYLIYFILIFTGLKPLLAVTVASVCQAILSFHLYHKIVFK